MNATGRYILKDKKPTPVPDLMEWAQAMERDSRRVAANNVNVSSGWKKQRYWVSTVFLGLDHGFLEDETRPVVFETMIKDRRRGKFLEYQERYCTWKEAMKGHRETITQLKARLIT